MAVQLGEAPEAGDQELGDAVSWRISARLLDHLLGRLRDENHIAINVDGWISGI